MKIQTCTGNEDNQIKINTEPKIITTTHYTCVISGFRRDMNGTFGFLGCYADFGK
jgi:hypothetical protein